jgi:hypothetical protein
VTSRALVITSSLLLATLIVALIGYAFYRSYYKIYEGLSISQNITYVLNKVKELSYQVSVNQEKFSIRASINESKGLGIIKVKDLKNNKENVYKFYFDPRTGIYRAEAVLSNKNSSVPLDVTEFENYLEKGVTIYPTAQGSLNITVRPSLAPLLLLYDVAKELNISWTLRRGVASSVAWEPITYKFNGVKYKGVLIDISISAPPVATSMWERVSDIRAVVIRINDLEVFPLITIVAGGNTIVFNLTSIKFSG